VSPPRARSRPPRPRPLRARRAAATRRSRSCATRSSSDGSRRRSPWRSRPVSRPRAAGRAAPRRRSCALAWPRSRARTSRRSGSWRIARKSRPADPDAYATGAEIYASAGKLESAWDEIKAGDAACGKAPELTRARGIAWISRQGGGKKGLELLEDARKADPSLPFVSRALGQAHLLLGKESAAAGQAEPALAHARAAASYDAADVDVARFLAEALAMGGDLEGALRETQRLVDRGLPLTGELALLHKKAGMAALLARERERALEHFASARRLGLTDEELGSGARILEEEIEARVKSGVEAYGKDDLATAEASFRGALALEPDRIEARNHLGVLLFRKGEFAGAAECWRSVIGTAEAEGLVLPEPVHVNLAKALALAKDLAGARETLEGYLAHHPDGEWVPETRAALAALPAGKSGN
jgi:tetratricopeptide (TPR) repeat protein